MKKSLLMFVALLGGVATTVWAAPKEVPVSDRTSLTMTIYNQGRALVNDTRRVDLTQDKNTVSFLDISNQVMPETVLIKAAGVSMLEQNFNFDLLNHYNMMKKAVGTDVDVEWINPATGVATIQKATLLAFDGGEPVLKIGTKIETRYPGRVIFNSVPASLHAKPTLIFDLMSTKAGTENVELSYLTTGISWKADYVAELNDAENGLSLNGLVTLTNNTQVNYENAALQLVAGDVNMSAPAPVLMRAMAKDAIYDEVGNAIGNMTSEAISGYYLYTLNRPTDIMSNQTKQVSLLSGDQVKAERHYLYTSPLSVNSAYSFKDEKPSIQLKIQNKETNGLGMPLPKGTVRVYKKDSRNRLIFIGEDGINHTAKNQEITLTLGEDFDLTVKGKRVNYTTLSKGLYEASFEVSFMNAKTREVTIRFEQNLPNGWKIMSESLKSQKESANTIFWNVSVPAEGETILTYKVQVKTE